MATIPRPPKLTWNPEPQQERSRRTLQRLLDAGEALIREKGFDRASVAEIAERAGCSVGAFYTRFPDKDALFYSILQRFYEGAAATVEEMMTAPRWREIPDHVVVDTMLEFTAKAVRERHQLIATIVNRASRDERAATALASIYDLVCRSALRFMRERYGAATPDLEARIKYALWLLLSAFSMGAVVGRHPFASEADSRWALLRAREWTLLLLRSGAEPAEAAPGARPRPKRGASQGGASKSTRGKPNREVGGQARTRKRG